MRWFGGGLVVSVLVVGLVVASPAGAQTDPSAIDVAPIIVQVCCAPTEEDQLVGGQSWDVGDEIDLFVNDVYVATAIAAPNDEGSASPLFDVNALGIELRPGDEVKFVRSDGGRTEVHVVTTLSVSRMDVVTDTVKGTAEPGSEVVVFIPNTAVFRSETADAEGDWLADFSVAGDDPGEALVFDIGFLDPVAAAQFDIDGNATLWLTRPWEYAPIIAIVDGADQIGATGPQATGGQSWGVGDEVDLFINGVYVATSIAEQNGEGSASPYFDLAVLGVTIVAGDEITLMLSDGSRTETHIVTGLSVTQVDVAADAVSGMAAPGSQVLVAVPGAFRLETTNAAGQWSADFSQPGDDPIEASTADIVASTVGQALQFDEFGNFTWVFWKLELTDKDQCKNGGWQNFGAFKNQGQCVKNAPK